MKVKILVVDDEQEICDMLSRHFRFVGYDVSTAPNGVVALEIMRKEKVDIVISDIRMPEMDGIELLSCIRAQYPMVRVIMITGVVTLENALACMRLGAESCIFKPLEDLRQLEHAVDDAVAWIQNWLRTLQELTAMKNMGRSSL